LADITAYHLVRGFIPSIEDNILVVSTLRPEKNNFNEPTTLALQKGDNPLNSDLFTVLQGSHPVRVVNSTNILSGHATIYYIREILLPQPPPSSLDLTLAQRVNTWRDVLYNKTKLAAELDNLDGVTVFAPTIDAISKVPESASWNSTVWASVLAFNIVSSAGEEIYSHPSVYNLTNFFFFLHCMCMQLPGVYYPSDFASLGNVTLKTYLGSETMLKFRETRNAHNVTVLYGNGNIQPNTLPGSPIDLALGIHPYPFITSNGVLYVTNTLLLPDMSKLPAVAPSLVQLDPKNSTAVAIVDGPKKNGEASLAAHVFGATILAGISSFCLIVTGLFF
jgi:hypothetical protein